GCNEVLRSGMRPGWQRAVSISLGEGTLMEVEVNASGGVFRPCYVTADSDPSGEWMEVEATSVFHAAIYYCGACAGRSGGPPVPTAASIITVRVDGRESRCEKAGRGSGPMRLPNGTPGGGRLRKR